ncbi:MAG: DUF4249 family protein [Ignavibacteriales bacterium]|nr:DUF4249 family protein [Ignavibacteriales bacterium]
MRRVIAAAFVFLFFAAGCTDNPSIPEEKQLVLQAYLYADQPVTEITVMQSRPVSSGDAANELVSEASVILQKGGSNYTLTPSSGAAGKYFYAGNDLRVSSGDQFSITVSANGMTATSATVVPERPAGLQTTLAAMTFTHDTLTGRAGEMRVRINSADSMEVSWTNPNGGAYYVVIESVDSARQLMRTDSLIGRERAFRFVTEPTTTGGYRVNPSSIQYTGQHKIVLYKVNQEYVNLYTSRQQDSRSLNEPLTNVKNGMGIFTAFASDSTFINVVLQ